VPELNLLDFLTADHQSLLEAAPAPKISDVSQHLSVERDFLYPVISDHAPDGPATVGGLRHAERELESRLRDFERDANPEHVERLAAAIADHVAFQKELFTRLRGLIPEAELLTASESIALSIGGAPTHAHPRLAEGGLVGEVIEDIASVADHLRDRLHEQGRPEGD
jgi:hypothetical protein